MFLCCQEANTPMMSECCHDRCVFRDIQMVLAKRVQLQVTTIMAITGNTALSMSRQKNKLQIFQEIFFFFLLILSTSLAIHLEILVSPYKASMCSTT